MLAAITRRSFEKQLAKWKGRAVATRSLVDESRALHHAVGRAKQGRAVEAYARERIERLERRMICKNRNSDLTEDVRSDFPSFFKAAVQKPCKFVDGRQQSAKIGH